MTREELLATIHILQPGDLLFLRVDRDDLTHKDADEITQLVRAKVPDGVAVLVGSRGTALEQYRKVWS